MANEDTQGFIIKEADIIDFIREKYFLRKDITLVIDDIRVDHATQEHVFMLHRVSDH